MYVSFGRLLYVTLGRTTTFQKLNKKNAAVTVIHWTAAFFLWTHLDFNSIEFRLRFHQKTYKRSTENLVRLANESIFGVSYTNAFAE
jgi:hypothetical protein